jgi:hypothetical protein
VCLINRVANLFPQKSQTKLAFTNRELIQKMSIFARAVDDTSLLGVVGGGLLGLIGGGIVALICFSGNTISRDNLVGNTVVGTTITAQTLTTNQLILTGMNGVTLNGNFNFGTGYGSTLAVANFSGTTITTTSLTVPNGALLSQGTLIQSSTNCDFMTTNTSTQFTNVTTPALYQGTVEVFWDLGVTATGTTTVPSPNLTTNHPALLVPADALYPYSYINFQTLGDVLVLTLPQPLLPGSYVLKYNVTFGTSEGIYTLSINSNNTNSYMPIRQNVDLYLSIAGGLFTTMEEMFIITTTSRVSFQWQVVGKNNQSAGYNVLPGNFRVQRFT